MTQSLTTPSRRQHPRSLAEPTQSTSQTRKSCQTHQCKNLSTLQTDLICPASSQVSCHLVMKHSNPKIDSKKITSLSKPQGEANSATYCEFRTNQTNLNMRSKLRIKDLEVSSLPPYHPTYRFIREDQIFIRSIRPISSLHWLREPLHSQVLQWMDRERRSICSCKCFYLP